MVRFTHIVLCATLVLDSVLSKLIVLSPQGLKSKFKDGEIKANYANFGFVPYGHTMVSAEDALIHVSTDWKSVHGWTEGGHHVRPSAPARLPAVQRSQH